jgi:thioredoxin reductase (NADPH)
MNKYDLIIIGGGPAGLSAAVYAGRYKLRTLVFSKEIGGLAGTAHKICNFPSYTEVTGMELMQRFTEHAEKNNAEIIYDEVRKIEKDKKGFRVLTEKNEFFAKKVIFAGGTKRKELDIKGEKEFYGRGVSYCATCDAGFYKDKTVAVIGGSNAALTASLLLAEYAEKIYIIYRKSEFSKAEPTWVELAEKDDKIEFLFNEELTEIYGNKKVEGVKLKSGKEKALDGVFIEIGSEPDLTIIKGLKIETDKGYIKTSKDQRTNVHGFFVAGDVTNCELKQIVTAASQGAMAAYHSYEEIKKEDD